MANSRSIALLCTITRGGFTDERVFRIQLADGKTTYAGACPRQYCFRRNGRPLNSNEPERGKSLEGLVLASRIREEQDGVMLVSVPDGAVVPVTAEQIKDAPKELSEDVPVKP